MNTYLQRCVFFSSRMSCWCFQEKKEPNLLKKRSQNNFIPDSDKNKDEITLYYFKTKAAKFQVQQFLAQQQNA